MTDIAAGVLHLHVDAPCALPPWTGRAMQAWFLDQIAQKDSALAIVLHEGNLARPYTVSSLLGVRPSMNKFHTLIPDTVYAVRISTLTTELTRCWFDAIVPTLSGKSITIGEATLRIDGANPDALWAGRTTDGDLLQQYTLLADKVPRRLDLKFDSPMFFHSAGMTIPFPLPGLVFGSLADRWNTFNTIKLHPDSRHFAEDCIEARHYTLNSNTIHMEINGRHLSVSGGTGHCQYEIRRNDRYWQGMMHCLAAYSFYAGVGLDTANGFGRTKLVRAHPS